MVGYPPGAGYDMYARLIARRIGQYLPGTPKVVVQNMPGAGSLSSANHLYNVAKQDGSIIGTFSRGITMLPMIDSTGVRYETLKFNWIGSPSDEVSLAIAWHDSGVNKFEDLRTRGMTSATSGPGSDGNIYGRVLNTILGTKIKTVTGYQGSAESMLAIERKEVDGATSVSYAAIKTAQREWLVNKKINLLAQHALKANPELEGVPVILDFAKSEDDRRVLEMVFARQSIGYPYAAPPGCSRRPARGHPQGVPGDACRIRSFWQRPRRRPPGRRHDRASRSRRCWRASTPCRRRSRSARESAMQPPK